MNKIRLTPNLLILGTAFSLLAVSAMANNVSPPFAPSGSNAPVMQPVPSSPANSQSLGTLPASNMNTTSSMSTDPNAMPPRQASAPMMSSSSASDTDSLQPQQSGNITYVTGGIGDEERSGLKAVEAQYNLHIMSATKDGAFAGDTQMVILDHNGGELLSTASGPIFFAKMPAGNYTVQATHNGTTKKQNVTIGRTQSSKVHFSW